MRPVDEQRSDQLDAGLVAFAQLIPLPGVESPSARRSLVRQMIDSLHRIEFARRLGERPISAKRMDPNSPLFDPVRAAVLHRMNGDIDEAAWLIFLSTHFGFHQAARWELTKRVYGALGVAPTWTWARTSSHLTEFRSWFENHADELAGVPFGNHRKYESIKVAAQTNLADTIESYVAWVGANQGHKVMFDAASQSANHDPLALFDRLYSGSTIRQFGRTATFDYLTMLGKLGIVEIEPPYPYFAGASGPVYGAKLLLAGNAQANISVAELTATVVQLGAALDVGMQVMEDSLCNWQKSPEKYIPFRG